MPTHPYTLRDVERVLGLPRSTVRGLIDAGFVTPARGPRQQYRFSFQDLIVLRAARALIDAKVPRKRIRRSLEELRRHLPETMPLSGLSISAVGDRVVVRDGTAHFQVDDGQYVLGFDVSVEKGVLRVVERAPEVLDPPEVLDTHPNKHLDTHAKGSSGSGAGPIVDTHDWFSEAMDLEESDPRGAQKAYERAAAEDPAQSAIWINWGRLLHEQQQLREAEKVYRRGLEQCGPDAVLLFNLGVLLEDMGRTSAALETYQFAIGEDPNLADCHYNLARLYESLGQPQHAIRHLGQYRKLMEARG